MIWMRIRNPANMYFNFMRHTLTFYRSSIFTQTGTFSLKRKIIDKRIVDWGLYTVTWTVPQQARICNISRPAKRKDDIIKHLRQHVPNTEPLSQPHFFIFLNVTLKASKQTVNLAFLFLFKQNCIMSSEFLSVKILVCTKVSMHTSHFFMPKVIEFYTKIDLANLDFKGIWHIFCPHSK